MKNLHWLELCPAVKYVGASLCLAGSLCLNLSAAPAQEYMVKTWDVDDGLPESSVSDVVQTPDGYIWVSTLNSGVSRFDGVRFVNFDLPFAARFPSHGVRRLFVDASGVLWLNGFGNYLASLRNGEFHLEATPPVVITKLLASVSDRVVFSTKGAQLVEHTAEAGTNSGWKTTDAPGAGIYDRFFADAQGDVWYVRTNGQVARMVNGKAETMPPSPGAGSYSVLAGDDAGRIAVANMAGLFVWENGAFQEQTPERGADGFVPDGVTSDGRGGWWLEVNGRLRRCRDRKWIAEANEWMALGRQWSKFQLEQPDGEGGLWLASADSGVIHLSATGKLAVLTASDGLPSNRVRTMMRDREGNVWVSFERGGFARIRPRMFQSLGRREGLAESVTTSVCEDAAGAVWIGTASGRVGCWRDGVFTNLLFPKPSAGSFSDMSTVFPDAAGRIWIGTHGNGLWVWETNRFRGVLTRQQLGVNIRGIFASRDGRVWIASQDGLFCLADGQVQKRQTPGSEVDYPTALAEGADGTIWVAMNDGGLLRLTAGRVDKFQPPADLRRRFAAVSVDRQGTVWIGTLGAGLLRFRDGLFTAVGTRDGLPTDYISQVIEDQFGGLWLGSPVGVILARKEPPAGQTGHFTFHIFGRDDGLPTVGCATSSQPTVWRARDGRIWFAMASGVASVQPREANSKQSAPLVVIEEMIVDGKPMVANAAGTFPASGPPFKLSPGRHHLEFRFTGLDFAAPERLRFDYMLEGWDETWLANRAERTAGYNDLLPGKYRFRVKVCNSDGVWSETEGAVAFDVPPHVWETAWFRAALLAAVLSLVAGSVWRVSHVRNRQKIRRLEQQQALEQERTRIAQDIHDDLGASLTRIAMLSQSALDKTPAAQPSAAEVNRIYATARAMTRTMDEIVWAINPRHDSLDSVAVYFAEFVEEYLTAAGLKFRLEIPLDLPPRVITSELRHNLFLAFKEALNNAVKHARAGEVVVTLAVRENVFLLSVEDNGCGFDFSAATGNIPESRRTARGNGLENMRGRLAGLGGRCYIESVPGRGTRVYFEVNLPE